MADDGTEAALVEIAIDRRAALDVLADGPQHRRDLEATLDASKTTCHRIIRALDEHGLLERTEQGYTLNHAGVQLHEAVEAFYQRVRAIAKLEPLLEAVAPLPVEFDPEAFADARVTAPTPTDPTQPLNREFELFQEASYFTVVDANQHLPEPFLERVFEIGIERGMEAEHIAPESVIETRLTEFPALHRRHAEVDAALKYRVGGPPPFGLTLYDRSQLVLRAYDADTGSIELLIDTDEPAAIEWARAVIEHVRSASRPPSAVESLPEWTPDAALEFLSDREP